MRPLAARRSGAHSIYWLPTLTQTQIGHKPVTRAFHIVYRHTSGPAAGSLGRKEVLVPASSSVLLASAFIGSLGINTHIDFQKYGYENLPVVVQAVSYLGLHHVRDS